MKTLTEQEIFNKVATHLLTQGHKAQVSAGLCGTVCAYRTPEGLGCAVGCLFPKEVDVKPIENSLVDTAMERAPELFRRVGLVKARLPLLQALQNIHDRNPVVDWPLRLAILAGRFGLTRPELLTEHWTETHT